MSINFYPNNYHPGDYLPPRVQGRLTSYVGDTTSVGLGGDDQHYASKAISVSDMHQRAFQDMNLGFTGSDITAIIIRRDDPLAYNKAVAYLKMVSEAVVVAPLQVTPRPFVPLTNLVPPVEPEMMPNTNEQNEANAFYEKLNAQNGDVVGPINTPCQPNSILLAPDTLMQDIEVSVNPVQHPVMPDSSIINQDFKPIIPEKPKESQPFVSPPIDARSVGLAMQDQMEAFEYENLSYDKTLIYPVVNLQAITISTYRSKSQVRALGHVNPRGLARGSRTIGGTIILTEFDRDAFWSLIGAEMPVADRDYNIGDSGSAVLPDQLSPFNILLLFANEAGKLAYRLITEIELVTNGSVYSIQDMYHENTLSFLCTDVTPLIPLPPVTTQMTRDFIDGKKVSISPLAIVTSAKEVLRRFRVQKNSRMTSR